MWVSVLVSGNWPYQKGNNNSCQFWNQSNSNHKWCACDGQGQVSAFQVQGLCAPICGTNSLQRNGEGGEVRWGKQKGGLYSESG